MKLDFSKQETETYVLAYRQALLDAERTLASTTNGAQSAASKRVRSLLDAFDKENGLLNGRRP